MTLEANMSLSTPCRRCALALPFFLFMSITNPIRADQTAEVARFDVPFTYHYLLALPPGYEDDKAASWPLVVFLHGLGERGSDLTQVAKYGPPCLVRLGRKFPFVLISPQCPVTEWWNAPAVERFVEEMTVRYRIDRDRVYLTGLSMGGHGTWAVACLNPGRFAAIAPICGGGDPKRAALLKNLPVWAFHGAKDAVVPLQRSQEMIDGIRNAGGEPRFTVYPEATHDSWTQAYATEELYDWLLTRRRSERSEP